MRRNAALKQGDTSSIRDNTLSTNQTHSRGSTGPPEHLNHLKIGPCTCISHGGPPSSHLTENRAKRAQPTVGRPLGRPTQWRQPTGPIDSQMTRGSVWLVLHGGLARFPGKRLVAPSYKYKGRGENEHTQHTTHITHHQVSLLACV